MRTKKTPGTKERKLVPTIANNTLGNRRIDQPPKVGSLTILQIKSMTYKSRQRNCGRTPKKERGGISA
eukprot:XP_001705284.1 Hypothetical protein GL50803_93216 [Giardia lamblia ATCC 50803]